MHTLWLMVIFVIADNIHSLHITFTAFYVVNVRIYVDKTIYRDLQTKRHAIITIDLDR